MSRTSSKRGEILAYLRQFIAQNGYPPTVRQIMRAVGLSSTASVHYHLAALRELGEIDMEEKRSRAIRLSAPRGVPLVGTVAAGVPILAEENIDGYLPWEADPDCFALRVKGDSMINAHIFDGDTVVVRPQPTAVNGEIVVALLGDEATVKRFSRRGGEVWLLPENPEYAPIDGREARILGRVCTVIREL